VTAPRFDGPRFAVNVKRVWLGIKTVAPLLRARGGGVIVNTASTAGLRGSRNLGASGWRLDGVAPRWRSPSPYPLPSGERVMR